MLMASFLSPSVYGSRLMNYAPGARLDDIRTSFNSDKSRLVIESLKKMSYNHFLLSNPSRLVIDIADTESFSGTPLIDKNSPLFSRIRTSERPDGSYRVVVDARDGLNVLEHFQLLPSGGSGFRLVFDVKPANASQIALMQQAPATPATKEKRDLMVVVDAGHGGKDPGAIGPSGTREKDVVLGISRHLARLIDGTPGMVAKLTRDDDRFIPLRGRTQFARRHQSDFFLSIHADAFTSARPRGPSVFALSEKGASSETARWLAQKENEEPLSGGGEVLDLSTKDDVLAKVLMDLSVAGTMSHSLKAGDYVLKEIAALATPHKPHVEQAAFAVLKSPDIPSLLVEAGFLTNPQEERLLRTTSYQKKVAEQIHRGLVGYYRDNLPPYARLS